MYYYIILSLLGLLLISCGANKQIEYIPTEVVKTEYIQQIVEKRDSVYIKDSVFVKESNDTVFKYHYKDRFIERIVIDTLLIERRDSIPKLIYKEKPMSAWDRLKIDYFGYLVGLLLAVLGCIVVVCIYWIRKMM